MTKYAFYFCFIIISPFVIIAHIIYENKDYLFKLFKREINFIYYALFIVIVLKITAFTFQATLNFSPLYLIYGIIIFLIYLFTRPFKFILQFFAWSIAISLLIIALAYAVSNYDTSMEFIKNLHAGNYTQIITIVTSIVLLFLVQIFCDAPNWYEWLKDYEVTFATKTFKNIFQSEMIVFNASIFLWQKFSKIVEVKRHLKVDNNRLMFLKEFALTANVNSLLLFIITSEIVFMIIFGIITLILKYLQKRCDTAQEKHKPYFILKPKE